MVVTFKFADGSIQVLRPIRLESTSILSEIMHDIGAVSYSIK